MGTDGSTPALTIYTGAQHNAALGRHSTIGLHAIVDNVGGTTIGALQCWIEESCDGRSWIARNGSTVDLRVPASGALVTTASNQNAMADACQGATLASGPLLGFVRIRMYFTNNTTSAHVKLYCTQHDGRS